MEHLNQLLYLLINAPAGTPVLIVEIARFIADDLVWCVPFGLVIGWMGSTSSVRNVLITASFAGLTGLLVNQLIGLSWYHPRPFEAGLGRTLMSHVKDSSFPSDHLTLIWSVAFSLMLSRQTRWAGGTLALLGLPIAWARIFLGIHFPFDILGSLGVAFIVSLLMTRYGNRPIKTITSYLEEVHRKHFAKSIPRG